MKKLFAPSEICNELGGIKPIQITNLVDKGIIRATHPADGGLPGQGRSRLYDRDAILDVAFAISMRGLFSRNMTKRAIAKIREHLGRKKPWDVMVVKFSILRNGTNIMQDDPATFLFTYSELSGDAYRVEVFEDDPREYTVTTINVSGIKRLVDQKFQE